MLILLFVFALMALGVLGVAVIVSAGRQQKRAEGQAPELLDDLFDGDDQVVFRETYVSLSSDTVIAGAKSRGYRVADISTRDGNLSTIVFEKD